MGKYTSPMDCMGEITCQWDSSLDPSDSESSTAEDLNLSFWGSSSKIERQGIHFLPKGWNIMEATEHVDFWGPGLQLLFFLGGG